MNAEKMTSKALKLSIIVGFILILVGEIVYVSGNDYSLLEFGILFLIISPLIAVVTAMTSLSKNKEWPWVIAAAIMILITVIGVLVAKL